MAAIGRVQSNDGLQPRRRRSDASQHSTGQKFGLWLTESRSPNIMGPAGLPSRREPRDSKARDARLQSRDDQYSLSGQYIFLAILG